MKKIFVTVFVIIVTLPGIKAQQDAQFSQYMFNSLVINPAYAGYRETLNVSLLHRDQWGGIKGAPKTQSLVIDGAFFTDKKVGLGLTVVNDKSGLLNQSSAYANYAYRIRMGENDSRLSFGLAIGVAQYRLDGDEAFIDDPSDPNFNGGQQNYFTPDAKFGVFYSDKKFYAGFSATNLLSKAIQYRQPGSEAIARQSRHYFLTAGYLLDVNDAIKFKPSFLLREDMQGPSNVDVNSFFLLKEKVWIGASYRAGVDLWKKSDLNSGIFKQNSLVGVVEIFFHQNVRIGYAYDYSLSPLSNYSNGTHEVSLGFVLNAGSDKKSTVLLTPRYF